MRTPRRLALYALVTTVVTLAAMALVPGGNAWAHGAMMRPGSRTFLCWQDGLSPQGNIVPINPACAAAVNQNGPNALYNWFGVLRSDGAGRTRGFIPDGQLCSGGNPVYAGFDIARNDYPVTHLTAGANLNWRYSNWAAHPGTFSMYVTRNTWSPTRPLAWDDLEPAAFLSVTNPAQQGSVGTNDGHYYWSGNLPSGKSGRHIIYSIWARSDSQETFYGCSDVVFDGGNGEVTGVGRGGSSPSPTPTPTATATPTPAPTTPAPTTPAPTTPAPGPGGCTATVTIVGSWPGGFQADVTVRNTGSATLNDWAVAWTMPPGATIAQGWSATYMQNGATAMAHAVSWNRTLAPGATATAGFLGSGSAYPPPSAVRCA